MKTRKLKSQIKKYFTVARYSQDSKQAQNHYNLENLTNIH